MLLAKLNTLVKVPDTVSLRWENDTLIASGAGTREWLEQFNALPFGWLGIEKINYSELKIVPTVDK